jgi:hypothetical protein
LLCKGTLALLSSVSSKSSARLSCSAVSTQERTHCSDPVASDRHLFSKLGTCFTGTVAILDLKQDSAIPGVTIGTLLMVVLLYQALRKEAPSERSSNSSVALRHREYLRDKIELGDCFYVIKEANLYIAYKVGNSEQRFTQIIPTRVRAAAFATNQNISLRKISKNGAYLWELVPKSGAQPKSG